jgi:hypothetical protein
MHSQPDNDFIHPALTSFADECCGTLARLMAYVGALVLFAIVGLHFLNQLRLELPGDPADQPSFVRAERSRPAFAVSSLDPPEKSESYEIYRHPEGGRKDIFHWGSPGEEPAAELEIYRPGGEFDPAQPRAADLAARMGEADRELEAFGVIGSKFGNVALVRRPGRFDAAKSCLGFVKQFDDPALQISGWSCQGTALPARRAAIGCMLDRLTLLASGNEPRRVRCRCRGYLGRLGHGCGKPPFARAPVIAALPRHWFSCDFFDPEGFILRHCCPFDLVTAAPAATIGSEEALACLKRIR